MQSSDSFVRAQLWADLMRSSKHSRNIPQSYIVLHLPRSSPFSSYISFVLVNIIYTYIIQKTQGETTAAYTWLFLW